MSSDVLKFPGTHSPSVCVVCTQCQLFMFSTCLLRCELGFEGTGQAGLSPCWCPLPLVYVIIISQSGEGSVAILAALDAEERNMTPLLLARASGLWAEMDRACLTWNGLSILTRNFGFFVFILCVCTYLCS